MSKGSHDSKVCRFPCLRSNFALTSMSLSGRPFLYDTMSGSLNISLGSGFCCVMTVAHEDFFGVLKWWMVLCIVTWIAFFPGDFRQLQVTRHWSIGVHVSCYLMTYDVIESKGFPNSPEVMLFFQPEYKFTFSCFQNFLVSISGC